MEFHDPDAERQAPPWATAPPEVAEPRSAMPRPIPEIVILGLGLAVVVGLLWLTAPVLSGGLFLNAGIALMQIAYPLGTALVAGAVTSLLRRRVLRGHRQIQAEEAATLRDELAALAERIDAARS